MSRMAETASILSPDKTVLLPDLAAGCSLADTINAEQVRAWKAEHPGAVVVAYVNTTAEVKGESDYCCTSGNAVEVIEAIPADQEILFLPDMFLGAHVRRIGLYAQALARELEVVLVDDLDQHRAAVERLVRVAVEVGRDRVGRDAERVGRARVAHRAAEHGVVRARDAPLHGKPQVGRGAERLVVPTHAGEPAQRVLDPPEPGRTHRVRPTAGGRSTGRRSQGLPVLAR